jgi:tellurite resistance protein TehA-like permease
MTERVLGAIFLAMALFSVQMAPGGDPVLAVLWSAMAVLGVSFIARGWRSDA